MTRAVRTAVIALVIAVATGIAAADHDYVIHKVKKGDTLSLLAAEYYGDRDHAVFIMVANGMQHPRELKPGEKLHVPVSREVTTAIGDTFDGLAQQYLGDKRRGPYLAEFNDMTAVDTLAVGQTLTIPFTVVHTAAGDETLASIAAAYFGDSKNAEMLRGYNFLDRDAIGRGESIIIPINHVKVRASALPPPDAESKARTEKRKQMNEAADRGQPRAQAAWRQGDYAAVKRALIGIDLDFLDAERAALLGMLLGGAYVALGDDDSAVETFRRVLERRPKTTMSAYRYSPRIRAVWIKASGVVEGG